MGVEGKLNPNDRGDPRKWVASCWEKKEAVLFICRRGCFP